MLPYIFLFIAAIYFAWLAPPKIGRWGLFLLMLTMSMFRGMNVGGDDTIAYYKNAFEHEFSLTSTVSYDLEILFVWWTGFIKAHYLNPRWCLYSLSLIQFLFLYLSSKRYNVKLEKVLFFFLLLNYYYLSLEISRQFVAVAILLYGYSFIREPGMKKLIFLAMTLLATSIHLSSILGLLVFLCGYFNIPCKIYPPLLYIVFTIAFIIVQTMGTTITAFVLGRLDYINYYNHLAEETNAVTSASIVGYLVLYIKMIFNLYVLSRIAISKENLITNVFFVGIIVTLLFSPIGGNIRRLIYLVSIIDVIAYSLYFKLDYIPKKTKQSFLIIVTVFWGAVCLLEISKGNYFLNPYYMTLPF